MGGLDTLRRTGARSAVFGPPNHYRQTMTEDDQHPEMAVSAALPAEALGAAPGPRSVLMKVLRAGLSGGLLVLLFLVIIPALCSLDGVGNAIQSMSVSTFLLLLAAALVIRVLLAAA